MKKILLMMFLLLVIILGCKFRGKIDDPKFTAGKVTSILTNRGGTFACYYYYVNNKEYIGMELLLNDEKYTVKINKYYYIKFSSSNPNNNELLFNIEASDTLKPPLDGWKEIPY